MKVRRIVGVLAGAMIALIVAWEGIERAIFGWNTPDPLSSFHLLRGISIAIVMSSLAAWLILRYRRGYEEMLRIQSEESRRVREFFENIVQDAGEGIVSLDNDDVIRSWNRSAQEIYGYAADEILGRNVRVLIPADLVHAREPEMILEQVRKKGFVRNFETRRLRKDGTEIRVRLTRSILRDAEGKMIGSSAIVSDVSQEKDLETRLLQAEKLAAIGQAAASIAHEVRNALAGIAGTVEVLKASAAWKELPEGFGEEVDLQVSRIAHIVADLLSYARPGRLLPVPTDLHRILESALSAGERLHEAEGKSVERDFCSEPILVDVDPARLEQAVGNVVTNAFQAMPKGGRLVVATGRENGTIQIRFTDDGCGMSREIAARAFEPFYTTKVRGTGLGLPIVRTIVEAHHGHVDIRSAPGAGTTVTLILPAAGGTSPQLEESACVPLAKAS